MSDKKLEDKIIKLDPLAKALDDVGMTGGASKSLLSRGVKKTTKDTIKNFKKTDKLDNKKINYKVQVNLLSKVFYRVKI